MNLYEVLELNKDATQEEIKKSYRKIIKTCHGDVCPGDKEAEVRFKQVQSAYEILSDPNKKAEYDRFGTVGRKVPQSPVDIHVNNIWENFFGGTSDKGRSVQIRVELTLNEVLKNTTKPIKIMQKKACSACEGKGFSEWQACTTCSGSGKAFFKQSPFNIFMTCQACAGTGRNGTVKCPDCAGTAFIDDGEKVINVDIPAGVDTGMQIRIPNQGEPGKNRRGDAFVIIIIKDHELYSRQGKDIVIEVPVCYTQLVLGDTVTIPNLDHNKVDFEIPPGTQSGTKFRMKNLGLPDLKGTDRGDLIAIVRLEVPMTPNYKAVLEELAKCEKENITPKRETFKKKAV